MGWPWARLLLWVLWAACVHTGCAVRINRGMPKQVSREEVLRMRGGSNAQRDPAGPPGQPGPSGPPPSQPPPAPARAIVHAVPASQMSVRSHMLDFHKAGRPGGGAVEFTALRSIDGDNATQMWARAPRKGGYLEVTLRNVRGAVARIELAEHDADFCKACEFTIGKRRFAFKGGTGESIDIMPPEVEQSFRITVAQTQVVWWQLFEVRVFTTAKTAEPSPEARRHLQDDDVVRGSQQLGSQQPNVQRLEPQRSTARSSDQPPPRAPVPPPRPPPPPPPPTQPVCVPTCAAGHGDCILNPAYVPGNKPRHGQPQPSGICDCRPGWTGSTCDLPVCTGCDPDHGTCIGPGVCNCKAGWSGKACTMRGEVVYGTSMSFKTSRAPKELLHASAGGVLPTDDTRMAVVTSSDKQHEEISRAGETRWQVLGPPGTSDDFLRGEIITDGAIIRLRHHASGRNLQVDQGTPAVVRRDLKQVSLSAEEDGAKEAFYVLVDRRHERSKRTERAWGVGSEIVLVHCKSGYVLATSGEKLATRVGAGHRLESEVHAQAHIPNAQGQFWSIHKYELPEHRPPIPLTLNSIVRLVAPPIDSVQPVAHGELSDTCYLAGLGGSIDCVRSIQGHELWVVLPREEQSGHRSVAVETESQWTARTTAESNGTLVHMSRFTLLHAASMGTMQVIRKPDGKKIVGVGDATPANKQADCLSVSLGTADKVASPWLDNAAASLHFCGTRLSLSLGKQVGTWIPEVVKQLPGDAGEDDIAAALAELSMKRGLFAAAAQQYSAAIEKRALRDDEDSTLAVPTHMLHFKRAIVRTHTGQNAAAIWDLEQSIRLQPNFLEALLYRSRILLTLGRWKDAAKGFKHIAKSHRAKEALVYRARQYQSMLKNVSKTLEKAEEAIAVAAEAYGGGSGARCRMSAEDRGVLLWARERLTEVLNVAPESVAVRRLRAETSLLANDLPAVKADATWAIRLDGSNPEGHFLRARSHHLAMDDELAAEFYRWCLKLDHDHIGCRLGIRSLKAMEAVYTYANLRFRIGDFEGALAEYANGIELAPGHCALVALMHLQRCRCFIYLNEPKTAQGECAISYKIDPSLEDAEYLMKNAAQIASNYQRILEEEQKAKEEEEKKQEAEEAKKRRMQEELQMNATNVTIYRKEWITEEEKMEAQLKNLPICDQHFFRLNMTNSTHPKPGLDTSTNDVKRAYRKASMIWHPDKHRSEAGKARAEKKFQQIVEAYELLSDEKQLQLCLKGQEPTSKEGAQKEQQPPEPPKPGRPPEEPAPEEPPIAAHLAWTQHLGVSGLLSHEAHHRAVSCEGIHEEVLYSLSIVLKDRSGGPESQASGLSAWGSPDHTLRCDFEHQEESETTRSNKYEVRDEYGQATAGDTRSQSNAGQNSGQTLDVPTDGSLSLQFAAPLGSVLEEDKRHIDIEFQEYHISDLLKLEDDEKGLVDLRFALDNREGGVNIFLAVSRYTKSTGQPALRLDSMTASFDPGYWMKKKSMARKRKVAPMNGLDSAGGSSMHNAFDGDLSTFFKSAKPLVKDQAIVVDLNMIYQLSKIDVKEQMGHECVACSIEISCDQHKWWPVHTFTAGAGEVVEWKTTAAEEQDSMGFVVQGAEPKLILARFVRIIATAPAPAPPPQQTPNGQPVEAPGLAWHLQEVEVFGEELGESLTADAPVWLGMKEGVKTAVEPPLEPQTDYPPSAATDANLNTGFRSLAAPAVGHTLTLDLQALHLLALIELYQPAGRHCSNCAIEHSIDQKSWQLTTQVKTLVTSVAYGPNNQIKARYMQVAVVGVMNTVWEVAEFQVYGTLFTDAS